MLMNFHHKELKFIKSPENHSDDRYIRELQQTRRQRQLKRQILLTI